MYIDSAAKALSCPRGQRRVFRSTWIHVDRKPVTGLSWPVGWGRLFKEGRVGAIRGERHRGGRKKDATLRFLSGGGAYARRRRRRGGAAGSPEQGAATLSSSSGSGTWRQAWQWCVEEERGQRAGNERGISGGARREEERGSGHIHRESDSGVEGGVPAGVKSQTWPAEATKDSASNRRFAPVGGDHQRRKRAAAAATAAGRAMAKTAAKCNKPLHSLCVTK
ncbi:hypothetical protein Scep_025622 [Stephania cephalantha]|uniref:Uncharacterized protein n=1 Tax=Stephania cephalantha TaxID=152367 RepID=A0AAP0HMG9_9MAGN